MKPGEELDRLIAEKVMGLSFDEPILWDVDDGYPHYVPSYSTDITVAWNVVEQLDLFGETSKAGDICSVFKWIDHDTNEYKWTVGIRGGGLEFDLYIEWAESAPHAICLAALKAVGVTL